MVSVLAVMVKEPFRLVLVVAATMTVSPTAYPWAADVVIVAVVPESWTLLMVLLEP